MARPARAAATSARAKATSKKGKARAKKPKDAESGSDANDQDEVTSTSSEDIDQEQDDYQEPDSDAIDEDSDDPEQSDHASDEEPAVDSAIDEEGVISDEPASKRKTPKSSKVANGGSSSIAGSASVKKRFANGKNSTSPSKRRKKEESDEEAFDEDASLEDEEDEEMTTADGRKITKTKLVKAPKSTVEPGMIDPHTMAFLSDLVQNNDREWFAKNDPRYRHALQNWQDFVKAVQTDVQRGDWTIPELPAKDLIHRIYRDVRFSNDKTPYKRSFSASFSRAGRKGPFAGYYLQISPGRSLLAGGKWGPDKNELATIRTNILHSSKPFRRVINNPKFIEHFGPAKPDGRGEGKRCNVFGADDALKIAPKIEGVTKAHKDIDLLKLRTIGVVYDFTDGQVLSEDFMKQVGDVIEVMSPLVQLINDLLHPSSDNEEENGESEADAASDASAKEESDEEAGGIEAA